jgi:predicted transcriptional regulator
MKETIVAQRKVAREGLKALKLAEILDNIMNIIVRAKILNINEHRGTKTVKSWPWGV